MSSGRDTDAYRRNLQRAYLDRMGVLLEDEDALQTDIAPFARGSLHTLRDALANAQSSDRATQLHFRDAIVRIDMILDPN